MCPILKLQYHFSLLWTHRYIFIHNTLVRLLQSHVVNKWYCTIFQKHTRWIYLCTFRKFFPLKIDNLHQTRWKCQRQIKGAILLCWKVQALVRKADTGHLSTSPAPCFLWIQFDFLLRERITRTWRSTASSGKRITGRALIDKLPWLIKHTRIVRCQLDPRLKVKWSRTWNSRRMFRISSTVYRACMPRKRISHNEYHDQFREYQIAHKQKSRVLLYEHPKPKNSAPTLPLSVTRKIYTWKF